MPRPKDSQAPAATLGLRGQLVTVSAVTLIALLPFVDKAFFIDDTLFLRAARQIQEHPLDFYGCRINWYGWEQPLYEITKNPPGASYLLALAAKLFGWSELALHLCFLVPAIAAATGTCCLARRFCTRPVQATLLAVATPAFVVSATSVMCDTLMLAFWCWAIEFWFRGLDGRRWTCFAASSLLIAAAALTKYFGISLIPLLAAATFVQRKRFDPCLLWLALAVGLLVLYEMYTVKLYGTGMIAEAIRYGVITRALFPQSTTEILAGALVYPGGCSITLLCLAPVVWSKREWMTAGVIVVLVVFLCLNFKFYAGLSVVEGGRFVWSWIVHLTVFTVGGAYMLILAVRDLWRRRDGQALFLGLWLAGTWFFAVDVNWTISARGILPAAPVLGILLARQLDHLATGRSARAENVLDTTKWTVAVPIAIALLVSMCIAWGDYATAGMARTAAREVLARKTDSSVRLWFVGHWGFQYYMEAGGAKCWDYTKDVLPPEDWVAFPFSSGSALHDDSAIKVLLHDTKGRFAFEVTAENLVATLVPRGPVSFYSRAALPFEVGYSVSAGYLVSSPIKPIPPFLSPTGAAQE